MFQPQKLPVSAHVPMQDTDDDGLIARSCAGDRVAVHALVARYAPVAFRIAYRMLGGRSEAEDAAHDVLTRMLLHQTGWPSRASLLAWLRRAVINRAIDTQRRNKTWASGDAAELEKIAHDQIAADEALSLRRREQTVAAAMLRLPERQRAAITLCFYERLSLSDAAIALSTTVGAVESLMHRAKATLKEDLIALREDYK